MLISSMAQNQCDQQYITSVFGRAWKGTPGFSQQGTAGLQCLDLPAFPLSQVMLLIDCTIELDAQQLCPDMLTAPCPRRVIATESGFSVDLQHAFNWLLCRVFTK
jgi:hypothetical protein